MVVQRPQSPSSFTRSCTTTSVTSLWDQVTPTAENGSVSGFDTVSAGTPGSSFPELATSSGADSPVVGARDVGALEVGALEVGGLEVGALEVGALEVGADRVGSTGSVGSPSAVTTASPSGSATEPRAT